MEIKKKLLDSKCYIQKKIHKIAIVIYLFFKFRYQILTTFIYLRKLNLSTKKLVIKLDSRNSINLPPFIYPASNISIATLNGTFVAVGRVSNGRFEDNSDLVGRPIQLYRKNQTQLQNGIIKFNLLPDGETSNLEFLHTISPIPNYEDPRIFILRGQEYVVMTQVRSPIGNTKSALKCGIVVENIKSKHIVKLPSPNAKGIEKNWVPVENNKCVVLLYSSNPVTLIEFEPDKPLHKLIVTQNKSSENLNSRTQVIKTPYPEIPYIRIASKKVGSRKYGYTPLHYFEILSENLRPISLSRPFIFSSRKQEYCQGIAIINSKIYLSWSEQEKYNYIGSIEINEVIKLFIK